MTVVNSPSISILLLCWNHAEYLERCVSRLAAQTDRNFEIVFLDNRSSDGSFEVAQKLFAQSDLSATMIRNEAPQGISANLNRLFASSTGLLVCPLSTDDWYKPRYVAAVRAAAIEFPDALWFHSARSSGNDAGDEILNSEQLQFSGDVFPLFLRGELALNMNGVAYRRCAIEQVGGWDEEMPVEDFEMFFRLAQLGQCQYIDEALAVYRQSPGSISRNHDFMIDGAAKFFAKHGHHFPVGRARKLSESIREIAAREIDLGRSRSALRLLCRAARTDASNPRLLRTAVYLARSAFSGRT